MLKNLQELSEPELIKQTLGNKDWRMSRLYEITDINGVKRVFQRNKVQQHFNLNKADRNIILKSRRLGFTTDEALDSMDDALWTPNFHALMLSYDIPSQLDLFDSKIDFAWENLIQWFSEQKYPLPWKIDADRASQIKVVFPDKSTSSVQVRTKGRGGTLNRIHISEFGKTAKEDPLKAKEILSGTIQAAPIGARVDIESTAESDYGLFHQMFWEAWDRGEPLTPVDFKAHFYNWQWDEGEISKIKTPDPNIPQEFKDYQREYNEKCKEDSRLRPITDIELTYYYYRWLSLGKDWDLLHQEYPTTPEEAFVASGVKLFSPEKISKYPTEEGRKIGDWIYYEEFIPGHRYACAGDPSEGVGRNNATGAIIDFDHKIDLTMPDGARISITRPKLVAEYASSRIDPTMFAFELKNGAERYGSCIIAVERNSSGLATIGKLREIYNNIYTEVQLDKTTEKQTERLGWRTDGNSKPKMLYDLNAAINNDEIWITSRPTKRELSSYDKEDLAAVKFDEDAVHHWDRVIALAICYQMMSHAMPSMAKGSTQKDEGFEDPMDRYNVI